MEIGIKAKEIMNRNFPLLDSSLTLENCIKKLNNRYESCVILDKGFIHTIISYDDLLRVFFKRKKKNLELKEISAEKNFVIVSGETDVYDIIELMKKRNIDFIVVYSENEYGLITKKEIVEVNQLLFDRLRRQEILSY